MSEHIVHTSIMEDSFNFISISDEICQEFKEIAENYHDFALLGSITRGADRFSVNLLKSFRDRWDSSKEEDKIEEKLAFVFGWLTHRSADRQMKPIWRGDNEIDNSLSPSECSVYHEAFMFKEYHEEENEIYNMVFDQSKLNKNQAAVSLKVKEGKKLIRALLKGALIEMHTLIPGEDDIESWLENLFSLQQTFKNDLLARYAEAIYNPEPEKIKKYITDVNFFKRDEPLLKLAKEIRSGNEIDAEKLSSILKKQAESQYAIALKRAYLYLKSASDFFKEKITIEQLEEDLHIGKKGRHGGYI